MAAVPLANGQTLAVANSRTGTISLLDTGLAQIQGEFAVGAHLADLALVGNGPFALAVDDYRHELLALEISGQNVRVRGRMAVPAFPASVIVSSQGRWASVAAKWSHQVQFVRLTWPAVSESPVAFQPLGRVTLNFAPRLQCWLPGEQRLVVADAFGGHLALIDAATARVLAQHEIEGHNVCGLALAPNGNELVLAHQILDEHSPTSLENIERGALMRNVLERIPIAELERVPSRLRETPRYIELGMPERGAADPAGLAFLNTSQVAVAFAGVNEVELGTGDSSSPSSAVRLSVGKRPTALVRLSAERLAVLNTLDDSVSIVNLGQRRVTHTVALGPLAPLKPQDRGELLFFDGRLSRDGWLSCHSCHTEGHTSGLLADTQGDGTFGTPKRTLTLLGTGLTYRWAWNGQVQNLHEQVQKSLAQTMHGGEPAADTVADLTSFLVWLPPPPPLEPATAAAGDRAQWARGQAAFHKLGCAECHIPPLVYASHESFDVGLRDEKGLVKFNPPSLRGVGQGYRFLHDNRARSLRDVFTEVGHPHGQPLAGEELEALLRFLRSL